MSVTPPDVIMLSMTDEEINSCIKTAEKLCHTIVDRKDLHERDYLERFNNIVMGEIAEQLVLKWLNQNGKYAKSAVDKNSGKPDLGHDIIVRDKKDGHDIKCSIKSSLSVYKSKMDEILPGFTIASKPQEMREINIQVYFWLRIRPEKDPTGQQLSRVSVPSTKNVAIIGWIDDKTICEYHTKTFNGEKRNVVEIKLHDLNPMKDLLAMFADK